MLSSNLNNAQLSLLELLAEPLSQDDLKKLKDTLVQFRYQRLQKMLDEQWNEQEWTQKTLDNWYKEHNRTPYNQKGN